MTEATKALSEYVFDRDRHEFSLGDTLDIKTGLLLACLTFLAFQASNIIGLSLSHPQMIVETAAIVFLILGGILSIVELWPRDYMREAMPDAYEAWISSLEEYQKQYPDASVPALPQVRLSKAKERIQANSIVNGKKTRLMFLVFYCVAIAFLGNLITLAMRLF